MWIAKGLNDTVGVGKHIDNVSAQVMKVESCDVIKVTNEMLHCGSWKQVSTEEREGKRRMGDGEEEEGENEPIGGKNANVERQTNGRETNYGHRCPIETDSDGRAHVDKSGDGREGNAVFLRQRLQNSSNER